jgi:hypothetical protein
MARARFTYESFARRTIGLAALVEAETTYSPQDVDHISSSTACRTPSVEYKPALDLFDPCDPPKRR